jgi:hypothetical protein
MYKVIRPEGLQKLPIRMLYQPTGPGLFHRACEADGWRGLVAALLDEPEYEIADAETRLVDRLRLADDVVLLGELEKRSLKVGDRNAPDTINISSDEPFIRSLHRLGFVSLEPMLASGGPREVQAGG